MGRKLGAVYQDGAADNLFYQPLFFEVFQIAMKRRYGMDFSLDY
jgi:hypothetical protein